jgi:glycerophosphoryl diester phosphodiesterase
VTSPSVLTVAHRGASAYAPENTLAAVRQAVELGCGLVEVDVQRTRDGALVLLHDVDLGRTTDAARVLPHRAPWRVADLTHDELSRLDAGSWLSPAYAGERIPTLGETVDVLATGDAGLLLEVKHPARYPGITRDVAAVLRARPHGRVVVQSFDHAAMHELACLEPSLSIGLLGHPGARRLPALGTWASQVNPHHRRATPSYVEAVHAAGMTCLVWTVDRVPEIQRALALGVDGVITNRPDVARQVLDRRLVPA